MSEGDCVFCKIASGEIDTELVFKDETAVAFLDANPLTDGHTVVIPRNHYRRLSDLPKAALGPFFSVVQDVNRAVKKATGAPATNVGINDGEAAGQAIDHVHVHIIPRRPQDGGGSLHSIVNAPKKKDPKELASALRELLG